MMEYNNGIENLHFNIKINDASYNGIENSHSYNIKDLKSILSILNNVGIEVENYYTDIINKKILEYKSQANYLQSIIRRIKYDIKNKGYHKSYHCGLHIIITEL